MSEFSRGFLKGGAIAVAVPDVLAAPGPKIFKVVVARAVLAAAGVMT